MMKKVFFIICLSLPVFLFGQPFSQTEIQSWEDQAKQVTIIRDNFGIPHVYGNTDANAVFGLMYAQCEDDFPRVEMNYIDKLGRLSEVYGKGKLYNDLLTKLVIDSIGAVNDYKNAPLWLKKLCNAFADGINFYLYTHPETTPLLLKKFEPWYPMLWTDGSIGAISTADLGPSDLKMFYEKNKSAITQNNIIREEQPTGSNGFAFSPKITESGKAILYINPHVTFYFRPEVHVVSNEGLNAYGAVTWGQFFVYQGFNEHCGWMHTSSYADVSDSYIEDISSQNGKYYYKYNGKKLPVKEKNFTIRFKDGSKTDQKTFKTFFTGHGPVLGMQQDGKWLSVRSDNRNVKGLIQSWQRTKAQSFAEYKKIMGLLANASNNTVYADAEGNIAYWHGNFIPKRNPRYDWSKPVDGTTSATEWKGLHTVNESIHIYNPENGWIQNCNSTPFTAAGEFSPRRTDYPVYMAPDGQNFRGLNAIRILPEETHYTIEKVIEKGYDTYLTAFELLMPSLIHAFQYSPDADIRNKLQKPLEVLQNWDYRVSRQSVATTLAIYWGEKILPLIYRTEVEEGEDNDIVNKTKDFITKASSDLLLSAMVNAINELDTKFGSWETEWGSINRFQRISGDIENHFNDDSASLPVAFVSSTWGMLPSYSARTFPGTTKRYGINGNSFVCAVEFGKKIKAKSLLAGGESGHTNSPHFFDQGEMYANGKFKDVIFYKEDVVKHAEKTYHPG